eukprot:CAMPEP_0176012180 /NCGR_PEP_ID=MMETSP0120_2-20121206/5664_1 /TAXON_ID=160619 /ORGANISM="Kryptoperidinium foliaceum, Strain CCMP 1326" /LENGTH=220 /DNA_ID=CAMNT_0017345061 /DNA_START=55 /DNA_END=713 /DNA_ORIENTATION=+
MNWMASSSRIIQRGAPLWQQTALRAFASSRGSPRFSLPRAPKQFDAPTTNKKWRTHNVSLDLGYYAPMQDEKMLVDAHHDSPHSWENEEMDLAQEVQAIQEQEDERKRRWIENAKPPIRKPVIDERGRAYGRGGRKTAAARVWIQPGLGHVTVNRQDMIDYFERTTDRELVLAPLVATATCGKFDVTAMVTGGGLTGQAGAIRHGLARALNHYNPDVYRP